MRQKRIIFPRPLYDRGGWLSSDIGDSSYNKLNTTLGYAGNTLNALGAMMNQYGQIKHNNQSIFNGLGAQEQIDKEEILDSEGNGTGEFTEKHTGIYTYDKPLSKMKRFGLRSEGFYIKENEDGTYSLSRSPNVFANGGWGMAGAITSGVGDTLTTFSNASRINDNAVRTAQTLIKNDVSNPIISNSFDSLMKEAASLRNAKVDWTRRDMQGGSSAKNIGKGVLSSIGSGLKAGFSTANPYIGGAVALAGIGATIWGNQRRKEEGAKQANIANQYGQVANVFRQQKIGDAADYMRELQGENYLRGYAAEGGPIYTGNFQGLMPQEDKVSKFNEMVSSSDDNIGVDSLNLGELSENQEVDGLSQSDIRKLRKAGYKFDIIG